VTHAALWSGSADSVLDLHALLPAGQFLNSYANGIDAAGNIVGSAFDNDLKSHAILWRVVPEPSGVSTAAACAALALLRRRGRGR
jgi:hypothetical protein